MPTSHYFPLNYGGYKPEQNLIRDLVDEQIRLFGCDIYYLPREYYKDNALDDVISSKFKEKFPIEMILQNVEGFGQSEFISKFGLKVTQEITFHVSSRRWEEEGLRYGLPVRPLEGDLLFFPLTKDLYEIKFVQVESVFFQLGQLPFYSITAEIYEIGNDEFETDIDRIDTIERETSSSIDVVMIHNSGNDNFIIGEKITSLLSNVSATVARWDAPTRTLTLINRSGTFIENEYITGVDSGAQWTIESFSTIEDTNTDYDQNKYIQDESDDILDFSEKNPFGEYGNFTGSF
jgi:hypothetical protein